jgi:hypothetical protein
MRFAETSKSSDRPAPRPAATGRRFLSLALPLMALAVSFTPTAVHADTPANLPQGWTTDEPQAADAQASGDFQRTQVTVSASANVDADVYVDTDAAALSDFRDPLTPYGVWVDDSTYGTVWVPNSTVVGDDFAPYQSAGHWELDENGEWLWVSDYDWGYIPFHYGRWTWIGNRGWSWIPGRTYAPAWVSWRTTDYGYLGWAPMAPSWYWFGGSAVSVWVSPSSAYVFCPTTYVFNRRMNTYIVRDNDIVRRIGAHSRPYRAAQPSVGGGASARPYRPASPSLADAKVPSDAAPQKRTAPDSRALAYSRKSTTGQAKLMPQGRNLAASPAAKSKGAHASTHVPSKAERAIEASGPNPREARPSTHADTRPQTSAPSRHHDTHASSPQPKSQPSTSTSRPSTSPSRPSTSVSPSRPSTSPSRPSTSVSPSRPSVSPSRPSSSPSRPSFSPSRPSPSFSPRRR